MAGWGYAPPREILPDVLAVLPPEFRLNRPSQHGQNQKRGRLLDSFLEGPVVIGDTLYLVDIPFGRILSLGLKNKQWDLLHQYDGEPNGLAWHPQRSQLIIADFKQGILAFDVSTRKLETIMARFNGERLKGPNDLVITRDGAIIFTDQGMSGLQDPSGRVYRLSADGRLDVLLRNGPSPNGLVLNEAQDSLFVAMTRDNSVWLLPLYPDGSVQRTGRFSTYFGVGGPDGMATDAEGNVFVAHSSLGTVFVHRKDGTPLARILTTAAGCSSTNMTWGRGRNASILYIVESESGSIMSVPWHCAGVV